MHINLCFFAKKNCGFFFFTRIQPSKIVIKAKTVNYFYIFFVKYSFKPESYNSF